MTLRPPLWYLPGPGTHGAGTDEACLGLLGAAQTPILSIWLSGEYCSPEENWVSLLHMGGAKGMTCFVTKNKKEPSSPFISSLKPQGSPTTWAGLGWGSLTWETKELRRCHHRILGWATISLSCWNHWRMCLTKVKREKDRSSVKQESKQGGKQIPQGQRA